MKRELAEKLLGSGFFAVTRRQRRALTTTITISLVLHIIGLIAFGSWVIMRSKHEEKTVFIAPPPIKTYEPRKLEHSVKVCKRQRSSSRPSMVPRMVAMKTASLSLPKINIDPKVIHTSFQPKFKAVAGKGLGVGMGTGYGLGGFGEGVSEFNFFGIRGRGDRITILVDVSVSMVEEDAGGPAGYERVKARLSEVIGALNEAAFFNVAVFADAASVWQPNMMIANESNKRAAKDWLQPFNTEGNFGLTSGNVYSATTGVQAAGGTTRLDLALTSAFEQGADTILIISDGEPKVEKPLAAQKMEEYSKIMGEWQKKNAGAIAAADAAPAEKVWVEGKKGPLKEGDDPRAREGHWEVRGKTHRPAGPPEPKADLWTLSDFIQHFEVLYQNLYAKKSKKPPVIHTIGYQIDKEGGRFLQQLSDKYQGRYRRVAKIK
ncbi:MAG: hypothetical protein A3K19_15675 [Lentisphaerae bacterium RIFOXYB12_FULL_65_16]|nr:MAG: hypothetical protein A3K18_28380 [Lentisphaerae bacterium RIFOXYA12_64_32]OGV87368.1 MAG: hypothetical protein A3K19_15675 [Lentisphaerae bacterium RIFOXYB12_FULL_65_16]